MLLLRHASAGDRAHWNGPDHERPLDDRGRKQADALVETFAAYRIAAILTSPYVRCVQTVGPLARARGLEPEVREELSEELQATEGIALVRARAGEDVVVCGHGGLDLALGDPPRWRKGATFVVDAGLDLVDELPPPR
jgi:phosphohistidine phosphatase SixA